MITQPTFTIDDFYTELANHRDSHGNRLDIIKREDYRNDKHPDNGLLYVEAAYYSPRRAANGVNLIYTIASTPLTSSGVIFFQALLHSNSGNKTDKRNTRDRSKKMYDYEGYGNSLVKEIMKWHLLPVFGTMTIADGEDRMNQTFIDVRTDKGDSTIILRYDEVGVYRVEVYVIGKELNGELKEGLDCTRKIKDYRKEHNYVHPKFVSQCVHDLVDDINGINELIKG